jgi:hypothetical protein
VNSQPHSGDHSNTDHVSVRELLLGYLDEHPTAMDTLDGIAQWWINRQRIDIEVHRVSEALAGLVRDGEIEEHEQGGVRFFRRGRDAMTRTDTMPLEVPQ